MKTGIVTEDVATKEKELIRMEETIDYKITSLLLKMGISPSLRGFHYIRAAIIITVANQDSLIGVTKKLYPEVGEKFFTSGSKVERGIRHAIESIWKNGGNTYFAALIDCPGALEKKPTNSFFLGSLTEHFRLQQCKDELIKRSHNAS